MLSIKSSHRTRRPARSSVCLDDLRWTHLQLSTKHPVPKAASNAEAVLVISKVVLEMVLLELLVPRRKLLVMEKVVGHVIERVAKNTTTISSGRSIPIVEEYGVRKFPEWCRKRGEQCRGHDEPVLVHGKVMVDAV